MYNTFPRLANWCILTNISPGCALDKSVRNIKTKGKVILEIGYKFMPTR
jgi:hypothetical protein